MTASSPSLVLVHAQEQLKGKLSLTPLSRFDIQLYHVQRHLAGQETCKPWEPMRQGSLVHNYSITGNSSTRANASLHLEAGVRRCTPKESTSRCEYCRTRQKPACIHCVCAEDGGCLTCGDSLLCQQPRGEGHSHCNKCRFQREKRNKELKKQQKGKKPAGRSTRSRQASSSTVGKSRGGTAMERGNETLMPFFFAHTSPTPSPSTFPTQALASDAEEEVEADLSDEPVEALRSMSGCPVCRKCQGSSFLPKKEDAILLSWNKNGILSLPPLVMGSSSLEEQRALKQENEDLRHGVYYKSASPRQTLYMEQVAQQEERLKNLLVRERGGRNWALEGGRAVNRKVMWNFAPAHRALFLRHYPPGAREEGTEEEGEEASSTTYYPDVYRPDEHPVLDSGFLAQWLWGPKEAAVLDLVLVTANFQRENLPLHFDSGVEAEGHGSHILTLTMGLGGLVFLHSYITHRTFHFPVSPGDVWGMKGPVVCHVEGEGEDRTLEHRWSHGVAVDFVPAGESEAAFRKSLNYRFVRRGSSLPELTAKAMQAREKRKRGEEGGVGQKAGKKLMVRR